MATNNIVSYCNNVILYNIVSFLFIKPIKSWKRKKDLSNIKRKTDEKGRSYVLHQKLLLAVGWGDHGGIN